jgi:hypothetical protein
LLRGLLQKPGKKNAVLGGIGRQRGIEVEAGDELRADVLQKVTGSVDALRADVEMAIAPVRRTSYPVKTSCSAPVSFRSPSAAMQKTGITAPAAQRDIFLQLRSAADPMLS